MSSKDIANEIDRYVNLLEKVSFFIKDYINENVEFNDSFKFYDHDISKIEPIEKFKELQSKCFYSIQVFKSVEELTTEIDLSQTFRHLLLETLKTESQHMDSLNFPIDYYNFIEKNGQTITNNSPLSVQLIHEMYNFLTYNISLFFDQITKLTQFMEITMSAVPVFNSNNKNIVIIGANGSGKTSLAREINNISNNYESVRVIPAQHLLMFQKRTSIQDVQVTNSKITEYLENKKNYSSHEETKYRQILQDYNEEFTNIIDYLFAEFTKTSQMYYLNRENKNNNSEKENVISILEELKDIWENLLPKKELIINKIPNIEVKDKETGITYSFNNLSDGEKNVFYYIANVLISPHEGYIFVDEPDNYLHPSIVEKLWNRLEEKTAEFNFVYITHNINFASSRNDAVFLWNISFTPPTSWEIKVINSFEGLPKELVLELVGSSRPVIFCEGADHGSIDYRFYQSIFGNDFDIKPVGGHRNVINYTKLYNEDFTLTGQKAVGIVDRDFVSEEYIDQFTSKRDDIYILPVNEVENLLCSEVILEHFYEKEPLLFEVEDYRNFKNKVFTELKKDSIQEKVALSYVKSQLDFTMKSNYIEQGNNFKDLSTNFDEFRNINLEEIYQDFINKLEEIAITENYEEFLIYTNLKELLTEDYIRKFFKKIRGKYSEYVLKNLDHKIELAEKMRLKYFESDIFLL